MLDHNPIHAMGIHHITARTKALEVATTYPLHVIWPYVRADMMVPAGMRAVNTVFRYTSPSNNGKLHSRVNHGNLPLRG